MGKENLMELLHYDCTATNHEARYMLKTAHLKFHMVKFPVPCLVYLEKKTPILKISKYNSLPLYNLCISLRN